ncbi:ABC transporter ATP-binding protein [Robiginitalea sp. SC105]|uniref:ABC transporter ATP-binding protein n=1 Tax=Robiginitalea sp. SC105 TaxID=2762332 RepID=UPI001639507F|nr:ABC transporter ATP-binding protein [Robiginitalea sp. SC105]MBC2839287.1 ABC transporter ATP-binding protein [Robiginitalea sp. SC105]
MIQIKNLHKRFGKNQVLEGLALDLKPGGIYAVLGPNGSGKTTLIKCILGMVLPDRGTISVGGADIRRNPGYREAISYLPQIASFPGNLRVGELIDMILDLRKQTADPAPLIGMFRLEPHLDKRLSALSGGTLQKVNLVLTFMFDTPLYILDEPTTGLDPASLIRLKERIHSMREQGKTLLVTTHIMQFVEEVADQVIYLLEGKIYFRGTLDALKNKTGQQDVEHAIAAIAMKDHV